MTFDAQVLVIAFVALSLKLVVWGAGREVVEKEEELHQNDVFTLAFRRAQPSKVDNR